MLIVGSIFVLVLFICYPYKQNCCGLRVIRSTFEHIIYERTIFIPAARNVTSVAYTEASSNRSILASAPLPRPRLFPASKTYQPLRLQNLERDLHMGHLIKPAIITILTPAFISPAAAWEKWKEFYTNVIASDGYKLLKGVAFVGDSGRRVLRTDLITEKTVEGY